MPADPLGRIERADGVLEDHRDLAAAQSAQLGSCRRQQIRSIDAQDPRGYLGVLGFKP